jgi:hypothetical protein
MDHGSLSIRLVGTEALQDDSIGPFAIDFNFSIRASDDSRHALPRRVELANIKDLILKRLALNFDKNRFRLSDLKIDR